MKKMLACFSVATLAAATAFAAPVAHAWQPPSPHAFIQEDWSAPPPELRGAEQQGFHDGIEGARKDAGNHRPPNVENRDEFRHPNVPHRDRAAYRRGFRRGYHVGVEHLMHGRG